MFDQIFYITVNIKLHVGLMFHTSDVLDQIWSRTSLLHISDVRF